MIDTDRFITNQRRGTSVENGVFIVIDLGKTLSKVSLWTRDGRMIDRRVRPNSPVPIDGAHRLDAQSTGTWLLAALSEYASHPIEYIIPVGHGAGIVALVDDEMAFLPLDYEQPLPDIYRSEYQALRDAFSVTGSPELPDGLNLGAQLYYLDRLHPEEMARATLVPWAQYWAWFLCGQAASEVTSLGCHTDLWRPLDARFSPLAVQHGWADRFAPLAEAGDVLGPIKPKVARATGLGENVRVLAGLHDSNAALLAARGFAEIAHHEATVLSTGTWFVAMRLTDTPPSLDQLPERRDCLVNVDVAGRAVPSARFMGGREIEAVIGIDTRRVDIKPDQPALLASVEKVVAAGAMLLPTLAPGCGPFPEGVGQWLNEPEDWFERRAAACLYAAMVADAALDLIGSKDRILVEGRFAEAEVFVRALARFRPRTRIYTANAHNDVSFGALRLVDPSLDPQGELVAVEPLEQELDAYRELWRQSLIAEKVGAES
jgi:sugar (pentulose or hexulose) kinase